MQTIMQILGNHPAQNSPADGETLIPSAFDPQAYLQNQIKWANEAAGDVTTCALCKGRGHMYSCENGYLVASECKCMNTLRSLMRIKHSGLAETLENCTFDRFVEGSAMAKQMKSEARRFLDDKSGQWLFYGGAVGCGKTHICTAVCGELIHAGHNVRYMLWRDEAARLKACVNEAEQYAKLITPLKVAQVLYIDDFWKTQQGKAPTPADVTLAFEILNYRYNNPKLRTIISTERSIEELLDIDEAVGSRLYERTKGFRVEIAPGKGKNYRLRSTG